MVKFEKIALCLGLLFFSRIAVPDSIVVAQANGRVFTDSKNKSAFDRIILKNRKVISGIVITKDHDGRTLVAVSRAWLQKNETLYPNSRRKAKPRAYCLRANSRASNGAIEEPR